ncbi:phosphate ABC transporter substrate-binding protein [uncultured Acetatifactor sp.]|uniref:phosphate ABC transporter substrate-binding protein n=1 Tax=uncultured Acetatifactor sp. TaxID=1671927 RepID=UPI002622FD53|nr:phosphate ABC transporter substrate-binding protein [uncultured Acetatifactor sp.]
MWIDRRRRLRNAAVWMALWGYCLGGCGGLQAESDSSRGLWVERDSGGGPSAGQDRGGVQWEGSLHLAGSSSMEKMTDALAERFMERYPEVAVTVQFTGSSAGIEAVVNGRADIGNASRGLTQEERENGATGYVVALDGIALCVDAANPVTGMTGQQLADIYTGEITNWSSIGGGDVPIVLIGREAGSGTREAFEELLGISGQCTYANELDSTGAVMARIASTPGAIGYVSFDALNVSTNSDIQDTVHPLLLDGTAPTTENVRTGKYPLCRPFLMVIRGELAAQSELVRLWFRYVASEEGQTVMERMGLVTVDGESR